MTARAFKILVAATVCLTVLALGAPGAPHRTSALAAASEDSREYLIKAAFLYNFAKFTVWPTGTFRDDAAPLNFCVYGEDPFGVALESIAGKEIRGRAVAVRRIATIEADTACQLLFISASEQTHLDTILESLRGRPVLTIGDTPNFTRSGGIISLTTNKEDRVRFEINIGTAKRAGLKLSSKLLRLAKITKR